MMKYVEALLIILSISNVISDEWIVRNVKYQLILYRKEGTE